MNFSGIRPLRFASTNIPFWGIYEGVKPLKITGRYETFVKNVLQKFNFNYEGVLTDDYLDYGQIYSPGNGTGLVGYLTRNESDVGFAVLPLTSRDFKYLDFTNIVLEDDWKIVTSSKEVVFDSSVFASANIFSPHLWICVGCSFLGFSIFWGVIERSFLGLLVDSAQVTSMHKSILEKFFTVFGAAFGQGLQYPPRYFGWLRTAVLCWVISVFVLNGGFTGCLLSKLTLPPKPNYIEEIHDLLRYPNMPIFIVKNSPAHFYLRDSTGETEQLLWKRIQSLGVLISTDDDDADLLGEMEKIYKRKQVTFLPDSIVLDVTQLIVDCNELEKPTHLSKSATFKIQTAFPMRKNLDNPHAKIFKYTAQRLFETGLILQDLWFEMWKSRHCLSDAKAVVREVEALQMASFLMAFYLFLLGTAVYLTAFIFEFCVPNKPLVSLHRQRMWKGY